MTTATTPLGDDGVLPDLPPLESDGGFVEVPAELGVRDDGITAGDDDLPGNPDPPAFGMHRYDDDDARDDAGVVDDSFETIPGDERGEWSGGDERPADVQAEIDEPPRDVPDGGEEGPERDPWDVDDTSLPPLDAGDDD